MHHVGLHYSGLFLWEVQELQGDQKKQAIKLYFHSSSTVPEPVEESCGSLGIWRISRSAALSCVGVCLFLTDLCQSGCQETG